MRCLVVGAGPVSTRKVRELLRCGASVVVVAPSVHPELERIEQVGGLEDPPTGSASLVMERRSYRAGEAAEFDLVIAATGVPEVDSQVSRDARGGGVWVNYADDGDECTFLLPSVHRDGSVCIAVSTGGASPSLSAWLRRKIGVEVGAGLGDLADLLEEARQELIDSGRRTSSVDWRRLLEGPLPDLVSEGKLTEARALLSAFMAGQT